jgi:hypothetical protein
VRPPSSVRKPYDSGSPPNSAFCAGFPATHLPGFGLCRRWRILVGFLSPCLCIQKFRSGGEARAATPAALAPGSLIPGPPALGILGWPCSYSGLSPSASNCRLHSVGGSRSRSMPMPRGRRASTAALTRLGARKASEMVMLTCRTLHFSRAQSWPIVVTRPETTSSSHRRPRAMALTTRARRSNCSGRTSLRDLLRGSRIWRDLFDGGFRHGIVSDRSPG